MEEIERLEKRLDDLSDQRYSLMMARGNADTDESANWYHQRIRQIDIECSRIVDRIESILESLPDNEAEVVIHAAASKWLEDSPPPSP